MAQDMNGGTATSKTNSTATSKAGRPSTPKPAGNSRPQANNAQKPRQANNTAAKKSPAKPKTPSASTAGAPTSTEHLTEELLERLLASRSVDSYLEKAETPDRSLPDYLFELLDKRKLKRADVMRGSGLNGTVVYDIFSGKSRPGHDHAVMLALGLKANLRETQRILRLAGASELWCKRRRDAVLIWCIEHGLTRAETDDELYRLGEKTLLGTDRLQ